MTNISASPQRAFVLHLYHYRETSALVDLLTEYTGRLRVIAKGIYAPKSALRSALEPFSPLMVDWTGKGELPILKMAENDGIPFYLPHRASLCGLYLNELLIRLLPFSCDDGQLIFHLYQTALNDLKANVSETTALRHFEKGLLAALGYALPFKTVCSSSDHPQQYRFQCHPHFAFQPIVNGVKTDHHVFDNRVLTAIANNDYHDAATQQAAKRLMRLAINTLLGGRPLKTRELF